MRQGPRWRAWNRRGQLKMDNEASSGLLTYSKEQLLKSKRFLKQRDLLDALLPQGEFTLDRVLKTIEQFLKREAV